MQYDTSDPFSTSNDQPTRQSQKLQGCFWIGGLVVVGTFLLSLGLASVLDRFDLTESVSDRNARQAESLQQEVSVETDGAQTVATSSQSPTEHPKYEQIVQFVDKVADVADETSKPELHEIIDYDRYAEEYFQRSSEARDNAWQRLVVAETLDNLIIGPPPPYGYQIIGIKDLGANRYRVYLECPDTYSGNEPVVWWIIDQGNMKLYDWCQLDFGIRSTTENFSLIDASDTEIDRYNEYIDACEQFFAAYDEETPPALQAMEVEQALAMAENYRGPQVLLRSSLLLTARRWHLAGKDDRAIAAVNRIDNPYLAPGAFRLKGDIYFNRGDLELAAKAYEQYEDLIGPWPHAQKRLVTIYRERGEEIKERTALRKLTRRLNTDNQAEIVDLLRVNDAAQNKALLARIDQSDSREAIYLFAVNQLYDSAYFADRYAQLHQHLLKIHPDSAATKMAAYFKESNLQNATETLEWIEQQQPEDAEFLRYSIWLEQDPENYASLLKSCSKPQTHFDALSEIYDYESLILDADMVELCNIILEADPENGEVLRFLGYALDSLGKHKQAAATFQRAMQALDESPAGKTQLDVMIVRSLYQSGDRQAAKKHANSPELVESLIDLKREEDDFEGFDELIERLDVGSDSHREYQALWDFQQGNFAAASTALAALCQQADSEEVYDGRRQLYHHRLIELCQKQNDVAKAFQLVPSDDMLSMLVDELISQYAWEQCDALLEQASAATSPEQLMVLRSRLLWAQADYQGLIALVPNTDSAPDNNAATDAWLNHEEANLVLGNLTRAALRLDQTDKAMEFARLAEKHDHWDDLVLLVALHQNDQTLALERLASKPDYETDDLYRELDLRDVAWRELIPAESHPRRQLSVGYSDFGAQAVRLLFQTAPEIEPDQLVPLLEPVLGKPLKVSPLVSADPSEKSWVFQSRDWQLQITQSPSRFTTEANSSADESPRTILIDVESELTIDLHVLSHQSGQAREQAFLSVLNALPNANLLAAEQYSWLLTAQELEQFFSLPSEQRVKNKLFGAGDFEGRLVDLGIEASDEQRASESEIQAQFVTAYRELTEKQTPATLIVQIAVGRTQQERIEARVDAIKRRGRDVQLQATLLSDSLTVRSLQRGDPVWLTIPQIKQFRRLPEHSKTN